MYIEFDDYERNVAQVLNANSFEHELYLVLVGVIECGLLDVPSKRWEFLLGVTLSPRRFTTRILEDLLSTKD